MIHHLTNRLVVNTAKHSTILLQLYKKLLIKDIF
jgi:hypothetical protein